MLGKRKFQGIWFIKEDYKEFFSFVPYLNVKCFVPYQINPGRDVHRQWIYSNSYSIQSVSLKRALIMRRVLIEPGKKPQKPLHAIG